MVRFHKRDAPLLIQSAVNDFVRDIASGNTMPEVPFDKLRQAATILLSFADDNSISWIERGRDLERAIGEEFLARLELRFRAATNGTHIAEALRYAERAIADEFRILN